MSAFLRDYLLAVIFFGVAMALVAGVLGLGSFIRPTRPQPAKYLNYESGVDPVGFGWSQSQIRYYIFAVRLEAFGYFGLVEMVIFIVILALGLVYAWRKGVLRWL